LGRRLSDFLTMLENSLQSTGRMDGGDTEDEARRRDGDDGYTRAGNTNVIVSTFGAIFTNGTADDDTIDGYNDVYAAGGDGDDDMDAYNRAVFWGNNGDDRMRAYNDAHASGGNGDDEINVYDNGRVLGGNGDDRIRAYDNAQIAGGAGNDDIEVYDNGIVDAGDGHDRVIAYSNALLNLGNGNDYAYAGGKNNRIDGGAGDDMITGGKNAILFGGTGDDHIGSRDNALIDAGDGDDRIFTFNHSIVDGGTGDDYVRMGDDSTFLFNKGDGWDVVESQINTSNMSGTLTESRIQFGPDISMADLDIVRRGPHLVINVGGDSDAVVIRNVDKSKTPSLVFDDGTTLSDTDIAAITRVDDSPLDEKLKTAGNKKMRGSSGDDTLSNLLHAEVWAGAGNDRVSVASESSVHFGRGDGHDTLTGALSWRLSDISKPVQIDMTTGRPVDGQDHEGVNFNSATPSGTLDTSRVLLDEDIKPEDIDVSFDGNDLIIRIKDTGDTLTIPDMGRVEDPTHRRPDQTAPNLEFADGTTWTSAEVLERAEAASQ
jgi:Ca2+-binding RTX toxin-like protein